MKKIEKSKTIRALLWQLEESKVHIYSTEANMVLCEGLFNEEMDVDVDMDKS